MRPTFKEFKKKALKDPKVKEEYEELGPAYALRKQSLSERRSFLSKDKVEDKFVP